MASSAPPPPYLRAIAKLDWMELVLPYVPACDWPKLCVVSKRFWNLVAPGLWKDPAATVRAIRERSSRLPPGRSWFWKKFLPLVECARAREDVRKLVLTVELGDGDDLRLLRPFPNVRAIVCPRFKADLFEPRAEPSQFVYLLPEQSHHVFLLSQESRKILRATSARGLRHLVCLDLASLRLCPWDLSASTAPNLRVLKLRNVSLRKQLGREIPLMETLITRPPEVSIWSLDVSQNNLDDSFLLLLRRAFPGPRLAHTDPTDREGRISAIGAIVDEPPPFSDAFAHEFFQVDLPEYSQQSELEESGSPETPLIFQVPWRRMTGSEAIREDTVRSIRAKIKPLRETTALYDPRDLAIFSSTGSITHLHLGQNDFSARGIYQIIVDSRGRLELFDCDTMVFSPLPDLRPFPPGITDKTKLSGILNAAHLIRPVISSNLQVLRIHHSLVTCVLTLDGDNDATPSKEDCWLAEIFLLARARAVFPGGGFQPNMNPRLRSLTLTRIPRYSSGPIIQAIIALIDSAARQEASIKAAKAAGIATLLGLRRISLEFEIDKGKGSAMDDCYTFFGNSTWTPSPRLPDPHYGGRVYMPDIKWVRIGDTNYEAVDCKPRRPTYDNVKVDGCGSSYMNNILVWAGSQGEAKPSGHKRLIQQAPTVAAAPAATVQTPVVRRYLQILADRGGAVRKFVEPATSSHEQAGIPADEFVYSHAWNSMMFWDERYAGLEALRRPGRADLDAMHDVREAIIRHRQWTREAFGGCDTGQADGPGYFSGEVQLISCVQ